MVVFCGKEHFDFITSIFQKTNKLLLIIVFTTQLVPEPGNVGFRENLELYLDRNLRFKVIVFSRCRYLI